LGFRCVAAIENGVVHVGASGVYIFDGASDKLLSFDLEPGWQDLVTNASPSDLNRIAVAYHQKRKELRIAVPRRYPSGTWGEWILDLNRTRTTQQPAWTATDRNLGGFIQWDGPESVAGNRGRLFAWESSAARVFEEATGNTANSSNLTATYEGPGLTLGTYRARWVDMRGEFEPQAGAFSVEPVIDGKSAGRAGRLHRHRAGDLGLGSLGHVPLGRVRSPAVPQDAPAPRGRTHRRCESGLYGEAEVSVVQLSPGDSTGNPV
jgi:hypothetical protein